jgi:hypothetical protein
LFRGKTKVANAIFPTLGAAASVPMQRASASMATSVPIAGGEDALQARIIVGYELLR